MTKAVNLQRAGNFLDEIRLTRPIVNFWNLTLNIFGEIYQMTYLQIHRFCLFVCLIFSTLFISCPTWRKSHDLKEVPMAQWWASPSLSFAVAHLFILKFNTKLKRLELVSMIATQKKPSMCVGWQWHCSSATPVMTHSTSVTLKGTAFRVP